MQGRLLPPESGRIQSFPRTNWEKEFELAREAGLNCIEWIYDTYGEDVNPLVSDEGLRKLDRLTRTTGVEIRSVCADYFMEKPLAKGDPAGREASQKRLHWLLDQCRKLAIKRIVLPFVDQSALITRSEIEACTSFIHSILPHAVECGVEIHLETDLKPAAFRTLLDPFAHPLIKANYDSGNSASLGYRPQEEFDAYGHHIGSVHVKDRIRNGGTVPLGMGDTDFASVFGELKKLGYAGDLILQVARGESGQEVEWARKNIEFVRSHYHE